MSRILHPYLVYMLNPNWVFTSKNQATILKAIANQVFQIFWVFWYEENREPN